MSWTEATDPVCLRNASASIEAVVDAKSKRIDSLDVGRVLPSAIRRLVGPFIFFDHMGPADLAPGEALDVRPHPHINLATVTYLFEGEILHRDSLGSEQPIRPGAINWMTAGRGIVHSERTPPAVRSRSSRLHGLQLWVALPKQHEETEPDFRHYPVADLPRVDADGVSLRILAGSAYGVTSPVRTLSPLLYVEAIMPAATHLEIAAAEERAVYVVEGTVACGEQRASKGRMLVFAKDAIPVLRADSAARIVLIGGAAMDGPRHIWWNFVSSSKDRIEQAKRDWREDRFGKVPGDDVERIPLPADA